MSEREYELYDKLESSHWWYRSRRRVLSELVGRIADRGSKSILEIGCGTGGNLKYLFTDFGRRTGVEFDGQAVEYARQKLGRDCEVIQGDANALELPDASFDCMAMMDLLYHANIRDVDQMFAQARRILKPGGHVLITDGAFEFLAGAHNKAVNSARRFTRAGLCATARRAGFEIVKASYWGVSLFFLLFLKRVILERLLRQGGSEHKEESFDLVEVPVVDQVLYHLVAAEKGIIHCCNIPLGASVCLLARKK